jgi:hypothetical protein
MNAKKALANYKKETGMLWETLLTLAVLFFIYGFLMMYIYNNGYDRNGFLPPYSFTQEVRRTIFLNDKRWRALKTGQWELIELKHGQKSAAHKDIVRLYLAMRAGESIAVEWSMSRSIIVKSSRNCTILEIYSCPIL